jgi:hypothetical protein
MNQVLNALALGSIAAVLAVTTTACTKSAKDPENTGYIDAALTVGGSRHDVTAIQYVVVDASGTCGDPPLAQATSPLEVEALPGSVLPPGAGTHAGADGLFVLPPGNYRVCATPLAGGGPSQACAPTEGLATVIPGATNEILLVSQCQGDANGGVDSVVTLNDPPRIDGLAIAPSKFIVGCETATLTATGSDPDGDAFSYAWSITSSPPGSAPQLQGSTSVATFATDLPGDYQVKVTLTDVNNGSSSLTFPMHVTALICSAQDQCHGVGSCDMSTLACSNPSLLDGSTCDDGDANTTSDVCSSGVCAGVIANPCACPVGFTPLPGGTCSKSYDIDAGQLVNQGSSCDGSGAHRFNGCNGAPYGFTWNDLGGSLASVIQVDVELESGISCSPGARTATLNGGSIGAFTTAGDCSCTSVSSLVALPSVPVGGYLLGGANTVDIVASNCEGLTMSPALNNAFARVTVTYGLSAACGGVCPHDPCSAGAALDPSCGSCVASICQVDPACCTSSWDAACQADVASVCGVSCGGASCGDGTCNAGESCGSCPADCGACAVCPTTDLGSTVPQTITGSTVGLPAAHAAPCAPSSAPEALYQFTAPADGTYTFSTAGSTFDTVLYVEGGTCGGASLACNDDYIGLQSRVQVPMTTGESIVVVVDGYGAASGSYTLSIN